MSKNDMARMSVSIMDKDKKTGGLEVLHEMFFLNWLDQPEGRIRYWVW